MVNRPLLWLTLIYGLFLPLSGEGCWSLLRFLPSFLNVFFLLFSSLFLYFLLISFPLLCLIWYLNGKESKKVRYLHAFLWIVLGTFALTAGILTPYVLPSLSQTKEPESVLEETP